MSYRLPSLNGLRAFEAAARHMSFTLAAEELNVTQTAVSHQIRRLEEYFSKPLFIRRNRNLELTPDAAEYLAVISRAFDGLRAGTDKFVEEQDSGILTITTVTSFAVKWLIPKLAEFQALHPDIEVRISTSLNIVDLQHDGIDLAIRFGAGDWPGMVVDHLLEEDIFPVCSPGLLEGRHALKSPQDLVHHTLLHTTNRPDNWRLWLTAAGVPTDPEDENHIDPVNGPIFDQFLITIQAAVDGLGVAIVSGEYVERDLEEGRLVRPFDVSLPTQAAYYLVSPRETAEAPKIKVFRAWLQGLVSQ